MHRDYARRERARDLERRNATARVCQHRHGPGICGTMLEHRANALGRVVTSCPKCERRRAGICRDCPRAVEGRVGSAVRCAECKARARDEQVRAYAVRSHDVVLANAKRRYRKNRAERKRRAEYKRRWRKLNPDKVKAQKRREALRQSSTRLEYHRAYRERRKAERARRELRRYHAEREGRALTHPCLGGCGLDLTGRTKKCSRCKARDLAAIAGTEAAA